MTEHKEHTKHVPFDVLNDYVDGRLDPAQSAEVADHISVCSACGQEHSNLVSLLRVAEAVPREVLPPRDIWGDIKAVIDQRKEVVLPIGALAGGSPATHGQRVSPTWRRWAFLGAAAVLLVAVSSAVTTLVLRPSMRSTDIALEHQVNAPDRRPDPSSVLPVGFRLAENGYIRTIAELRVALDAQRADLKPETVAAVERSLAVIDSAIAEARSALLSDPGNRTLVDLLSASYQRKLDLLRRASDLDLRT